MMLISFLIGCFGIVPYTNEDVYIRVVDVGAGLCCVVVLPDDHFMVYDAGNWKDNGRSCLDAVHELIPKNCSIDLFVLSHTDADHLGAASRILEEYDVIRVLHTGSTRFGKSTRVLTQTLSAIKRSVAGGTIEINLRKEGSVLVPSFRFGKVSIVMVGGFGELPPSWAMKDESEKNNASSIILRLTYHNKTVLFCGDAVGRHIGGAEDEIIASELFLVENSELFSIDSDILIAPHHGGDNAGSLAFIRSVSPEYVIFSSGHAFSHPRDKAVQRYLDQGVLADHIFRTDLGDDEGEQEWAFGRIPGLSDNIGDDDIDIKIGIHGDIRIEYHNFAGKE